MHLRKHTAAAQGDGADTYNDGSPFGHEA
jgi:hypothetical protein